MAVIKIKRGGATANTAPSQLAAGEMAVTYGTSPSQSDNKGRLYIGNADASANIIIGGQYFTSIMDHVPGTLTASSALIADANSKLDNLKVDNLDINGNNIISTNADGHIYITPNGTGDVIIDGLKYPQADGSAGQFLKTDGSAQLSWATVTSSFNLAADSGSTSSFDTGDTLTFTGTDPIDTTVGTDSITISIDDATTSAKGAASFASADFAVSSGEVTVKAAGITNAQLAGSITNAKLAFSAITIGSTSTALGATSTSLAGLQSVVVDHITVDGADIATAASNRDLTLTPHGTGTVKVPSGYKDRSGFTTDSLATKEYVDAVKAGLTVKDSVRAATTANITIATALNNGDTLDGVTLADDDRVLVKNQSTGAENGIYIVGSSPARATDMAASSVLEGGTFVFVEEGTANADNGYVVSTDGTITVGTTAHVWTQFSGAGQITAGDGLAKGSGATANTMNAVVDNATTKIVSDAIVVKSSGTAGQVLRSDGNTNAAAWGALNLASNDAVTGTLATGSGGTGLTGFTAGDMLYASSTSALAAVAKGSSGQFMTTNGTAPSWTSTIDAGTF